MKPPLQPRQRVVVGPLVFTSDFDSGNMGRVEKVEGRPWDTEEEYAITVAPDCMGTPHENGNRTWFYFGVGVADTLEVSAVCAAEGNSATAVEAAVCAAEVRERPHTAGERSTASGDAASYSADGDQVDEEIQQELLSDCEDPPLQDRPTGSEGLTRVPAPPATAVSAGSKVCEGGISVILSVCNMNNQGKLYGQGYRPWCKMPHDPMWRRLPDTPSTGFGMQWGGEPSEGGTGFRISWRHRAYPGSGIVYFAFCAPFSFADCQALLTQLDADFSCGGARPQQDKVMSLRHLSTAIAEDWVPGVGSNIYFHRQVLGLSLQGREIELLTVTAESNSAAQEVDSLPSELPDRFHACQPTKFPGRQIVFISARVHPGETPGQFVFLGALRFILSDDPRAADLRERFVFKMIPILNPDGVACGHYRTNSHGLNLNRCYDKPSPQEHEGVWSAKCVLMHWASQGRLLLYVDLHGHASKRGCFMLANRLTGPGQAWNTAYARLCQLNSPHFDFEHCDFAEPDAAGKECKDGMSKEGSGRVSIHKDCRLCHTYTLECNYHSGRFTKLLAPAVGLPAASESPGSVATSKDPRPYTQGCWAQVGEATLVSVLDLFGHNCCSRIPGSQLATVQRLLGSALTKPNKNRVLASKEILPLMPGLGDVARRATASEQPLRTGLTTGQQFCESAEALDPSRGPCSASGCSTRRLRCGRAPATGSVCGPPEVGHHRAVGGSKPRGAESPGLPSLGLGVRPLLAAVGAPEGLAPGRRQTTEGRREEAHQRALGLGTRCRERGPGCRGSAQQQQRREWDRDSDFKEVRRLSEFQM
ncbi:unnamed protein product, partial [Polarella glacialis]